MRKINLMVLLLVLVLIITGCNTNKTNSPTVSSNAKVTIAQQFGLAYAPIQIMKEKQLLEKYLPGVQVNWVQMGTGPTIRDAMVTGQVDIGFMGISPFLIGWDKGAEWKIATAAGSQPLALVTYKDNIKKIGDFTSTDRIATPAVASIQQILLSMEAEKVLGNPRALDNQMVSLTHPDAVTSLLAKKDVTAHFSSPPYIFQELANKDIHQVLNGEEAYGGEFTFIFGVATTRFHDSNPPGYAAFIAAYNEAISYINDHPQEAAAILAPINQMSADDTYKSLTWPGTNYCSTPAGLIGLAEFMKSSGYISKVPSHLSDIAFENVEAAIGKRYGEPSAIEMLQQRKNGTNGQ